MHTFLASSLNLFLVCKSFTPYIQLQTTGLKCESNIGKNHLMIGENDCKELHSDALEKKMHV